MTKFLNSSSTPSELGLDQYQLTVNVSIVRHKESQVIPAQQTEVLQFAGSDTEIQADQQQPGNVTEAVLEGRQGSPARKLPPLMNAVSVRQ